MKASRVIITLVIAALVMAAVVIIFGEPSDNSWRSFWICMAWKPAGVAAAALAWYLGKVRHYLQVVERARHIRAIVAQ